MIASHFEGVAREGNDTDFWHGALDTDTKTVLLRREQQPVDRDIVEFDHDGMSDDTLLHMKEHDVIQDTDTYATSSCADV